MPSSLLSVVQVRKPEVEARIVAAARAVFAERGFAEATIAEIAGRAEVATGNVYRYFAGKDELFAAAVAKATARELRRLVRDQIESLGGVRDVRTLPEGAPYRLGSEALLAFCVERRLEVVVLLGRARGTEHAGFAARLIEELVELAVAYGATLTPPLEVSTMTRFVLVQIYRGLVETMVQVLARFETEAEIRAAVGRWSTYHLTGLQRIFATEGTP
jgi:AcrR family transcriptional regulator